MDSKLLKLLREQMDKIGGPKPFMPRDSDFKIWEDTTSKVVQELFGNDYHNLFNSQIGKAKGTISRSVSNEYPRIMGFKSYINELKNLKKLLERFIQERERLENESAIHIGKNFGLADYDLHILIKNVAIEKFEDRYYADAVESAFKEVIKRVKDYVNPKINDPNSRILDGDPLMNRAFGCDGQLEPIIKFNNLQSIEEKDEQRGLMFLFKGIVGIRNRKAHENITLDDPYRAMEYLALASLLMRLLDEHAK